MGKAIEIRIADRGSRVAGRGYFSPMARYDHGGTAFPSSRKLGYKVGAFAMQDVLLSWMASALGSFFSPRGIEALASVRCGSREWESISARFRRVNRGL